MLLLAASMTRFLPHGREAAAISPLWGRQRRRPGEPRRTSVFAVLIAIILLGFGGFAAVDAYHGTRALRRDGAVLTIGRDTHVTHRERSSRGIRITFINSPGGETVTEGGAGHDGDRYGVFPRDANRAWYLGPTGWAHDVLAWALALLAAAAAGFLLWLQVGVAGDRARWVARLPP